MVSAARGESMEQNNRAEPADGAAAVAVATFGAGCFWCVEAVFEELDGVYTVVSGYQGGATEAPTYKDVCRGDTGHAEVVRVEYDPARLSYDRLLEVFWKAHDPTQLNRQGADVGTQYRSVIFYHDEAQREAAEASKAALVASGRHSKPVVTQIAPASEFYEAEAYHQDYYRMNPGAPYSRHVIRDKLKKLGLR
jgi:peptide-methionine (S)-S-oxide reductase